MERKVPDTDPPSGQNHAPGVHEKIGAGNPDALVNDARRAILPIFPEPLYPDDDEEAEEWAIRGQPGRPTQTREHLGFGPSRYRP